MSSQYDNDNTDSTGEETSKTGMYAGFFFLLVVVFIIFFGILSSGLSWSNNENDDETGST